MAQTVAYWQNKMLDAITADPILSDMNSPSQVSIYRLITFVIATCINLFEQALDIFKTEIETIAAEAVPGTAGWIRREMFKFQYSATNPQVVKLVNFVPGYDPVDTTLQIITRCSVKTMPNKVVAIKLAKNEPPEALLTAELNSAKSYMDKIGFAGVQNNIISLAPDRLYLKADIYYNGSYSAVIAANVIAAINTFLSNFGEDEFDGTLRVIKLIDAIQAVPGVTDVEIEDFAMRASTVLWASAFYLVQSYDNLHNKHITSAGYIIQEDTSGKTFLDQLNFIVE